MRCRPARSSCDDNLAEASYHIPMSSQQISHIVPKYLDVPDRLRGRIRLCAYRDLPISHHNVGSRRGFSRGGLLVNLLGDHETAFHCLMNVWALGPGHLAAGLGSEQWDRSRVTSVENTELPRVRSEMVWLSLNGRLAAEAGEWGEVMVVSCVNRDG